MDPVERQLGEVHPRHVSSLGLRAGKAFKVGRKDTVARRASDHFHCKIHEEGRDSELLNKFILPVGHHAGGSVELGEGDFHDLTVAKKALLSFGPGTFGDEGAMDIGPTVRVELAFEVPEGGWQRNQVWHRGMNQSNRMGESIRRRQDVHSLLLGAVLRGNDSDLVRIVASCGWRRSGAGGLGLRSGETGACGGVVDGGDRDHRHCFVGCGGGWLRELFRQAKQRGITGFQFQLRNVKCNVIPVRSINKMQGTSGRDCSKSLGQPHHYGRQGHFHAVQD